MSLYIRLLCRHIFVYQQYVLLRMCLYSTVYEFLHMYPVQLFQKRLWFPFYGWESSGSTARVFLSKD